MRGIGAVMALTLVLVPCQAREGVAGGRPTPPWQSALSESLNANYSLSKLSVLGGKITHAGTIVVVRRDGVSGVPADGSGVADNLIRDGQIQQKGRNWFYALDATSRRSYKVGERDYIDHLAVKENEIQIGLVTLDTYDVIEKGESKPSRFKAQLHFQFARGQLDTMSFSEVADVIGTVLAREDELKAAKTVSLGQTKEQVEAEMGKPETILDLGPKVVYVYKNLKIIFVDGRVTDVE
jgi:hypothetical protein